MKRDAGFSPAMRATRVRWLVFALACGTSWLLYLHRYTWNFIRPQLAEEYGFSNTQLEDIFTVFNFSYAFGQVPSGILCDFFGPHLFLFVIMLLWSLVLPGVRSDRQPLRARRLAARCSEPRRPAAIPALTKVTRNWFPRSSRTIVQGLVASFFGRSGGAMSSIIMGTVLMGWLGLELALRTGRSWPSQASRSRRSSCCSFATPRKRIARANQAEARLDSGRGSRSERRTSRTAVPPTACAIAACSSSSSSSS